MRDIIIKHALLNAADFGGKANVQSVMGKVLGENPELKSDMAALGRETALLVKEVNSWPPEKQKEELAKFGKIEKPEKVEREGLPPLPNAIQGKVVTRMPPEPSKYNHIGHALTFLINYMYAKMYDGKCILRFEDTNPEKVKQEYVDAMQDDVLDYLGIKPDKTVFVSDDMPAMYKHVERMIENGDTYVCMCDREAMQNMRHEGIECEHRSNSAEENMRLWKEMLGRKFEEGKAVLRLKGDMSALNQVMRDPVIFRIDYTSHFRQGDKYCVWPLYDFQAVVEDQLCEITHILRSSEFGEMRIELQDRIKDMLGFGKQTYVQYGRFEVAGFVTQGREIREMIESGKISGWDDPRLVTLKALKKRGIVRETYYNLAKRLGLNPTSAKMEWHMIASENRKVIDQTSKRYFFVSDPVEILLDKVAEKSVEAPLLPGKEELRRIPVTEKIYVEKSDFDANKGKEVRLMHFCNVILDKKAKVAGKDLNVPKIHWVPSENFGMKMVMPDATEVYGLAEPEVQDVEPDQIVQFERMGFARCEKKGLFYFAHK